MDSTARNENADAATFTNKGDPRTYEILGAAMEVHRQMGCGFLEAVYQEAMELELRSRGIPFVRQVELPLSYKGVPLNACYRADFVCFGEVIVELKALATLSGVEAAQVINYLKATGLKVGLLVNFGRSSLEYKRFILGAHDSVKFPQAESVKSVQSVDPA